MLLIRYCWEIIESAVNPLFFRKAVQRSAARAFGYYLFFTTIYTLAVCGVGTWWLSRHWDPTLDQIQTVLPAFEVRMDQGQFSTTLPQRTMLGDEEFTLIIDTSGQKTDLSPYTSAILISQDKAIMKKSSFETREYNFAAIPDFRLTTADAIEWLRRKETPILWTVFATTGLVVVPTIWMFLIPVILILMLLMMIPTKILRSNLSYAQVLSIGFYAVTFPTLLQTYFWIQGKPGDPIFRWIYLVWCLVGIVAARTLGKPKAPVQPSPPTAAA